MNKCVLKSFNVETMNMNIHFFEVLKEPMDVDIRKMSEEIFQIDPKRTPIALVIKVGELPLISSYGYRKV